jgi:hypothetical protein
MAGQAEDGSRVGSWDMARVLLGGSCGADAIRDATPKQGLSKSSRKRTASRRIDTTLRGEHHEDARDTKGHYRKRPVKAMSRRGALHATLH